MSITLDGTAGITAPAISGDAIATQAEAEAGTDNTKLMTPQRVRNALNATGTAPTYACRAWVNFNGTGTVAIRGSGNVSSITDNGVGDYTVNFTTAMPDANYSVVGTARSYNLSFSGADVITTTAVALHSWYTSNTSGGRTNIDSSYNFVSIFR
jgi:hypothetical protein